jgi:hypothetical protein
MDKNHMVISVDLANALEKIQYSFMIKEKQLGFGGIYLNSINAIYDKSVANIILNDRKLNPFLLKRGMRQGYSVSSFLFNIALQFITRVITQEEEIKAVQLEKEKVKLVQFADDIILYQKIPKISPKKLLNLINTFGNE